MRIATSRLDRNAAELLAIEALRFLGDDPERLTRFLALTGVEPDDIGRLARGPAFLGAVLDHVCGDATLLARFVAQIARSPEDVDRARMLLSGGDWERDTA